MPYLHFHSWPAALHISIYQIFLWLFQLSILWKLLVRKPRSEDRDRQAFKHLVVSVRESTDWTSQIYTEIFGPVRYTQRYLVCNIMKNKIISINCAFNKHPRRESLEYTHTHTYSFYSSKGKTILWDKFTQKMETYTKWRL